VTVLALTAAQYASIHNDLLSIVILLALIAVITLGIFFTHL
jgi:hypothetical protein